MQQLDDLAARFWTWRAQHMPRTRDDIPRVDRPDGWLPTVAPDAVAAAREGLGPLAEELAAVAPVEVADRIDHRLLRSALARVQWEEDVLRIRTQPRFWVDQTLGPVFDTLLRPGVDAERVAEVVRLLDAVPATLAYAEGFLAGRAAAEFADLAVEELTGVDARLEELAAALGEIPGVDRGRLSSAATTAAAALLDLRDWLVTARPTLSRAEPVGPETYTWFLREVACVPLTVDEIEAIGRREYERAVWLELLHRRRFSDVPVVALPTDVDAQVAAEARAEDEVRAFHESAGLLTQPSGLRRYLNRPMPPYLEPLRFLGVTDDLTGPGRLDEDGVSYVPTPTADLPFFYAANAQDPRAGIVHEGVHYQQLALSWSHPRPVRRHYYDSGSNEGIAFYHEELALVAGLFDDAPHSRTTMCTFMRLRALRVTVDLGLATGRLSIAEAAEVLETHVPMDKATALEEAAFFAETPGQALTYQVGKTQLVALVADATRVLGADLDLQALHDAVWLNGNVPIALQRWELLGLTDELAAVGVAST